jgi:hypothetical protein
MLEAIAKKNGFRDEQEFHKLVASVKLEAPGAEWAFKDWQHNDATKAGLFHRFPYLAPKPVNVISLINSMIRDIQRATGFLTKIEMKVTVEGLQVMVLIHNGKQKKTYGIDNVFTADHLADPENWKYLTEQRDKIIKAVQGAVLPLRPIIRTEEVHGMKVDVVEEGHYDPAQKG